MGRLRPLLLLQPMAIWCCITRAQPFVAGRGVLLPAAAAPAPGRLRVTTTRAEGPAPETVKSDTDTDVASQVEKTDNTLFWGVVVLLGVAALLSSGLG
mmetsp:Transcript_29301/g.78395  ORF Transcript_29301/g.78395 Transcript_29301/m.78395 type:complete len:98 (+) Transcript_29301:80-373(+)